MTAKLKQRKEERERQTMNNERSHLSQSGSIKKETRFDLFERTSVLLLKTKQIKQTIN